MYTAAVLADGQSNLLQITLDELMDLDGYLFETSRGDPLPHHMTINMGNFDESLNVCSMLHMPVELTVDGFWFDHNMGVIAARVIDALCTIVGDHRQSDYYEQVRTINETRHITMCLKPGVKPFLSNKLDWKGPGLMLASPLKLLSRIEVCP